MMRARKRGFATWITRSWWGQVSSTVVFLVILICLETIAFNHDRRFDLTPGQEYSLSAQTVRMLKCLNRDVFFTVFYRGGKRRGYEDLFRQVSSFSPNIHYRLLHLDQNPVQAKLNGIRAYGQALVESQDYKTVLNLTDEEGLARAILPLITQGEKKVFFTGGHGESGPQNGYNGLLRALRQGGWRWQVIDLKRQAIVPSTNNVLIILGPERDFSEQELDALSHFFKEGGNSIIMIEPFVRLPKLESLLEDIGLSFGTDIVVDENNRLLASDAMTPLIPYFAKDSITGSLQDAAVFSSVRSVRIRGSLLKSGKAHYLAISSAESWTKNRKESVRKGDIVFEADRDEQGPIPVAAIVSLGGRKEREQEQSNGAVICFGDADFITDSFFEMRANKDLFMNCLNWLGGEKDLVSIGNKRVAYPLHYMTAQQGRWIFWIAAVMMPVIWLLSGLGVFLYRRFRG